MKCRAVVVGMVCCFLLGCDQSSSTPEPEFSGADASGYIPGNTGGQNPGETLTGNEPGETLSGSSGRVSNTGTSGVVTNTGACPPNSSDCDQ